MDMNRVRLKQNRVSFLYQHASSGREGSLMMHEESPPAKNSFLEDLDKLDVSFLG